MAALSDQRNARAFEQGLHPPLRRYVAKIGSVERGDSGSGLQILSFAKHPVTELSKQRMPDQSISLLEYYEMNVLKLGLMVTPLALAAVPVSANDQILVCAESSALVEGKYNVTFYQGPNEQRTDKSGTLNTNGQSCWKRNDVRALNVTIWGLKFSGWEKGCDVNRRPGENLKVKMKGTAFGLSCEVF